MPYASDAQRKKFHVLEAEGKIDPATVKHWDKETELHGMKGSKKRAKRPRTK